MGLARQAEGTHARKLQKQTTAAVCLGKQGVENADLVVAPLCWGVFFPQNTAAECRGYNLQLSEMRSRLERFDLFCSRDGNLRPLPTKKDRTLRPGLFPGSPPCDGEMVD